MKHVPELHDDDKRTLLVVLVLGAANFIAFVVHVLADSTCALFGNGRYLDGLYLVRSHGKDIVFTPGAYWFSYIHGVVAVLIHIACTVWYFRKQRGHKLL